MFNGLAKASRGAVEAKKKPERCDFSERFSESSRKAGGWRSPPPSYCNYLIWLRGLDLNQRPLGYEPRYARDGLRTSTTESKAIAHLELPRSRGLTSLRGL